MARRIRIAAVLAVVLAAAALLLLLLNGMIIPNQITAESYPVRGVDVSNWQGDIDWDVLSGQGISFAFIKATEGSTFVDARFSQNWERAQESGLRIGAYHFFSYDSPGATQANHFIRTVPACENMLPPVIDLEFYGDKAKNPPPRDTVRAELDDMIDALENHYGVPPIIYATGKSYNLYLSGAYEDCDIWLRSVWLPPRTSDQRAWTFWQYTDRAKLPGYDGAEKFIDMNVFHGSRAEFAEYGLAVR